MRNIRPFHTLIMAAVFAVVCPALQAAPRLVLSSSALTPPRINPGSNGTVQTVEALNAGDGALNLTATASASWLSATVSAAKPCVILTGTCNTISISFATAALAPGSYTEYIVLNDPNAVDTPQEIAVTILVRGMPDAITLYVYPNGAGPASQAFSYIYPASAITATVSTQSGGNWLNFTAAGNAIANLPNTIQVTAQIGQAPGTYTGSVSVSGSTLASDNKTIAVTMIVTSSPIVDLSVISPLRFYGFQGGDKPYSSSITFPAFGTAALNITAANSSAAFVTAALVNSNTISITADPTTLTAGSYNATVTVVSNAANNALISIPVEFVVYPVGPNVISAGGIVNAASFVAESFSPGDIVSIFGTQLAAAGTAATNPGLPPLATKLGNVQVLVNGAPVPMYYASPKQINFQVPYSLVPGQVATVQVTSGGVAGNRRSIAIVASAPRILLFGGTYGVVANASDGSLALPPSVVFPGFVSHPAKPGDVLVFYAIGFGQTSPPAVEGVAASGTPLQYSPTASVTFGALFSVGTPVTVTAPFAGLTPSAVGLYQINVTVPANVPVSNALPVTVSLGGAISNGVNVAISANGK